LRERISWCNVKNFLVQCRIKGEALHVRCNEFLGTMSHQGWSLTCEMQWEIHFKQHINGGIFIEDLSRWRHRHQNNITLWHIEINDDMFVSCLLLDNRYRCVVFSRHSGLDNRYRCVVFSRHSGFLHPTKLTATI
jgi:hypothetical protein